METQEENTFKDHLFSSKFPGKLVVLAKPIVADHIKKVTQNNSLKYDELGDDREKLLKNAISVFSNLQKVVEDLDLVIYFLSLNRDDIKKAHPSISIEDYYNYHLENYIIRVNSIPDVLAGLGNIVCRWGIRTKSCYGTTIPNSSNVTNQDIKDKMESLLSKTESIRNIRNKKIHSGNADIAYFDKATLWDSFETIGITLTPELKQLSEDNRVEAIEVIKSEVRGVLDDVVEFMNIISSDIN